MNRKEGNDQESIQLPNTFRPRHQMERRTHLKQRHHNQNTTSRKRQKDKQFHSPKTGQTAIQNRKKNYQDIQAKTYNDRISKPQQKHRLRTVSKNLTGGCGGVGGA